MRGFINLNDRSAGRPRRLAVGGAALFAMLATAIVVVAPTTTTAQEPATSAIRVTGVNDGAGVCTDVVADGVPVRECSTLRAAVLEANSTPGPTTIEVGSGHYELTLGPLGITGAKTTLIGAGEPASYAKPVSGANIGSAVAGDATLIDAKGAAQAIVVEAADVEITGVAVTGATGARKTGGGIVVKNKGTNFVLSDSTIVANRGEEGAGVAVDRNAWGRVERSTFVGNVATGKGGGLRVDGTVDVVNSTFTENSAQSGGAVSVAGTATISYSTFVDNTSNNSKGGGVDRNGGTLAITGSILTQANQSTSDGSDCSGTPSLIGVNYVGNAQGCNPSSTTRTRASHGALAIEALADKGGPTLTIAQVGGPGVDITGLTVCRPVTAGGQLDLTKSVATDQRGRPRPSTTKATAPTCDLGAFELAPLALELNLRSDNPTPVAGARTIPAENIPGAVSTTQNLFDDSLRASPLNGFPINAAPLNGFPLNGFPLNGFPLNGFPLNGFFTAAAPLNGFPLNGFPLNGFPLNGFSLSDLVLLDDGGWAELLVDTKFEGVPLQSITLGDLQDDPETLAIVKEVSFERLNLQGTPLNGFPITAFLLGAVPLNGFPLNGFAADGTEPVLDAWRAAFPDFFAALESSGVDAATDERVTLASIALAGESLESLDLTAAPLNGFLFEALPLNGFPLNGFPLNGFNWQASPLNGFPLNGFPLNGFVVEGSPAPLEAIIDCTVLETHFDGSITCENGTIGDVVEAGAWVEGVTFANLYRLLFDEDGNPTFEGYSVVDLLFGLIPPDNVPWEQIDLTVSGLQNAADPLETPFSYLADVNVSTAVDSATVQIGLPEGFAYVPGTAVLLPAGSATSVPLPETNILSIGTAVCVDDDPATGGTLPTDGVVLTLDLPGGLPAGTSTVSIAVRASLQLGPAEAFACAQATSGTQEDADSSSTVVDVIENPVPLPGGESGAQVISGDVVNLGYISGDEDVDIYSFTVGDDQAKLGIQGDIFLSNIPEGADYDLTLFAEQTDPLRGDPVDVIGYVDDVVLDLNPFDDRVQADPVQDIPQQLPASIATDGVYVPIAVQANRTGDEQIRTGTLRAGTYYVQVSAYNSELVEGEPYALRLRTSQSLTRSDVCAALPAPASVAPSATPVVPASLDPRTNTLFLVNTDLFERQYPGELAAVLADVSAVSARDDLGVIGATIPVNSSGAVQTAYINRAADACDPLRSNGVVSAIGDLIDDYTMNEDGSPRLPIEYIVIVGDDTQIPMANIVDDANFANERTFSQNWTGNNATVSALVAGMYRTDDPYGTDAGIRVRDHELFVATRAVGRLVETPGEISRSLQNFVDDRFNGRLDSETERNALQTGYEFLQDGAIENIDALEADGYDVHALLTGEPTNDPPDVACAADPSTGPCKWTDNNLVTLLGKRQNDVIGLHGHADENNLLPAKDNFDGETAAGLFSSGELSVDGAVVYSMGCHAGFSASDIQLGLPATEPSDFAQRASGQLDNVFAGNTGFGYGDSEKIALAEKLTALFADEVGNGGSIGQAWVDAKQRLLAETAVLDAYQEKTLQQFVFYGLPMFHIDTPPPNLTPEATPAGFGALVTQAGGNPLTDLPTGPPVVTDPYTLLPTATIVAEVDVEDNISPEDNIRSANTLDRVRVPDAGSYFTNDGRTLDVNGRPVQPVFTAPATQLPSETGPRLVARDALITELTSEDVEVDNFDPFFFGASTDQDLPRGEYLDGSFPAELATVRSFRADRVEQQQLVLALGQFRADQGTAITPAQADLGTQRLHTRMAAQVYYTTPGASDTTSPEISRVQAFIEPQGEDVVFFEVDADESAKRVYILFRDDDLDSGAWTGLDLAPSGDGTWRGGRPFSGERVEVLAQAVGSNGRVSISDSKGLNFLSSEPTEIGQGLALSVLPQAEAQPVNGWYNVPVNVVVTGGAGTVKYSIDGAAFQNYTGPVPIPTEPAGAHVVTAIDVGADGEITDLQVIYVAVDKTAPTLQVTQTPEPNAAGFSDRAVTVTVVADDQFGSGVVSLTAAPSDGIAVVDGDPSPSVIRFTWDQEGSTTFQISAEDAAGNETTQTLTLNIDATAPVVTVNVTQEQTDGSSTDYTGGWVQDPVTVEIVATDDGSDIDPESITYTRTEIGSPDSAAPNDYDVPFTVGQGATRIIASATDLAGNIGASPPVEILVDETDPTLTLTRSPVGSPVTVTVEADDEGGSRVASVEYSIDGGTAVPVPDNGTILDLADAASVSVTVTDGSGRFATASIDLRAPTAMLTAPATSAVGGTASVGYLCDDVGFGASGVASCTLTVTDVTGNVGEPMALSPYGGTVLVPTPTTGTYTLVLTAVDEAGNTATDTKTISTVYGICLDYNANQGKRIGSNYTIKFRLCDGTNNLSSPAVILTAISVTDANGKKYAPGANFQGNSNAGFEFRFTDPGYTYNLDTLGLPYIAPGDYTLDFVVGVVDPGTGVDPSLYVYSAPFKLRK